MELTDPGVLIVLGGLALVVFVLVVAGRPRWGSKPISRPKPCRPPRSPRLDKPAGHRFWNVVGAKERYGSVTSTPTKKTTMPTVKARVSGATKLAPSPA